MEEMTLEGLGISQEGLRRCMAIALNYIIVDLNNNQHGIKVKGPNWVLMKDRTTAVSYGFTENDAWRGTPNWPESLIDAWALPVPEGAEKLGSGLAIWQSSRKGFCIANYAGPMVFGPMAGWAETPALAICLSWWAYTRKAKHLIERTILK